MYESHFHFTQTPFSIAPDPAFLYLSDGHREALAHLMYGFSNGGFVLVTGEVGTGKTTLLRNLVKQTPENLDVAFILNPRLTVKELLETLCDELGVHYEPGENLSVKQYIDALNRHLLSNHQNGRDTVVIIDEAQNLSPAVLEQIRLLTNLETDKRKLLRIILLGQPELGELLARRELRQLAQRITARYHLGALSREDTYAYVIHRLSRAGGSPHLFSGAALRRLYRISRGTPRIINLVADRALLGAYVEGRHRVNARLVDRAAREVLGEPVNVRKWLVGGALALSMAGMALAFFALPEGDDGGAAAPTRVDPAGPVAPQQTVTPTAPAAVSDSPELPGSVEHSGPVLRSATPAAGTPDDSEERSAASSAMAPAASTASGTPPARPAMSSYQTQRLAYQHVFEAWGADLADGGDSMIPCDLAPSTGLQCLTRTGSWTDIRRMNLPVVLELWDQGTLPFYAAVTALQDDVMTLHLGNEVNQVTPAALRDLWYGSFVVLWRMPPDYRGNLQRGDRHASVAWLRRQLATLAKTPLSGAEVELFDASLYDAVVAFQREEQLLADGVVGPATWIHLADRLDLPAPELNGGREG